MIKDDVLVFDWGENLLRLSGMDVEETRTRLVGAA